MGVLSKLTDASTEEEGNQCCSLLVHLHGRDGGVVDVAEEEIVYLFSCQSLSM